jgi:hypothetical protein
MHRFSFIAIEISRGVVLHYSFHALIAKAIWCLVGDLLLLVIQRN